MVKEYERRKKEISELSGQVMWSKWIHFNCYFVVQGKQSITTSLNCIHVSILDKQGTLFFIVDFLIIGMLQFVCLFDYMFVCLFVCEELGPFLVLNL